MKRQAEYLSQTRREHANEIAEDYVEAIADLVAETGEARVVDLAKRLGVTHVTVNRTISRLQKAGFVTAQPYRLIRNRSRAPIETHHTTVESRVLLLASLAHYEASVARVVDWHALDCRPLRNIVAEFSVAHELQPTYFATVYRRPRRRSS